MSVTPREQYTAAQRKARAKKRSQQPLKLDALDRKALPSLEAMRQVRRNDPPLWRTITGCLGMMRRPIGEFPTEHRTVRAGDRASSGAKGICAKFAVSAMPDSRRVVETKYHAAVGTGEECPNRAAFIDAVIARRRA